jgi:hypothetical protein
VGVRFSAPVQTSPGAHPVFYTMHTGSFLGIKQPGLGIDHPPPSSAEVKERVELYLYSTSVPSWPVIGCTLPLHVISVGARGGVVVKALHYKLAGRGFDSRRCHWNFSMT